MSVDTLSNQSLNQPHRKSPQKLKGLYAITDELLISEQDFYKKVEQALQGGAKIIQYRDKSNDTKKRQHQALSLRQLCEKYNALCLINDDIQLAKRVNAHGVHLGKDDVSLLTARDALGYDAVIGVSCYNDLSLALSAEKNGANYIAFVLFSLHQQNRMRRLLVWKLLLRQNKHFLCPSARLAALVIKISRK